MDNQPLSEQLRAIEFHKELCQTHKSRTTGDRMDPQELVELYGECRPPGKPVRDYELIYSPRSRLRVTTETAASLKFFMTQVGQSSLFAPTAETCHLLWLIDEHGDIYVSLEEMIDSDGHLIGVLPKATVARPEKYEKLGHPSLLESNESNARIAGEIVYDPGFQGRDWCLTNESGRFGLRPWQTEAHLDAAARLFESFGLYLAKQFYAPQA